jgi:SAM-dependent methyltransferase
MSPWDRRTAAAYRELGQQAHVEILRPVVAELLGDLSGGVALDFGCGPGQLTPTLAELGARRVIALDESDEMLAEARAVAARHSADSAGQIEVRRGNEAALPLPERCAGVLASLVLMMCATRARLETAATGLVGSLASDGRLVVVITHPCFRTSPASTFHDEVPEEWSYWASATPYDVVLHPDASEAQTAVITDYHWTVEDVVRALVMAGGVIRDLRELPAAYDKDGQPDGEPAYLVLAVSTP